ncbi:dehydrogenase/reductase SDR family member 4 [Vigna unguiculata]|uniref:Dehydrogenase/reductase SDR family member 4 n=1 Tax=Vigna unguiculata TaxID=3917 RepID=A0A4D6LFV2_VIGUN|nr:dehydrogenase/reductase SDR family member 4 [Vigna unguiculata]
MVKSKRFEEKVGIVTTSTQGIGLAIAKRLGLKGASVVISSRKQVFPSYPSFTPLQLSKQNVDAAAKNLRAKGIEVLRVVCHVSNPQQRKDLIHKNVQINFLYKWFKLVN